MLEFVVLPFFILEFVIFPLLLMIGVAWFMNFADGGDKPNRRQRKQEAFRKANNLKRAEIENKYLIEREKNPLGVEIPPSWSPSGSRHKEWLEMRVNRFEYQFQTFDLERAKEEEPVFKDKKLYKDICNHLKRKPDSDLIIAWENMK